MLKRRKKEELKKANEIYRRDRERRLYDKTNYVEKASEGKHDCIFNLQSNNSIKSRKQSGEKRCGAERDQKAI